jgi:Tfp pilus assembly protein PilF
MTYQGHTIHPDQAAAQTAPAAPPATVDAKREHTADPMKIAADMSAMPTPKVALVSANIAGPDRTAEFLQRGNEALQGGSPKTAAEFFQKAIAGDPANAQIPITAATCSLKHHDATLAVEILTPAAKNFPRSPAVWRCLAIAHLRTNDFAAAKADTELAIECDPSSALAYYTLGCVLANLNQLEAADVSFRHAATLDPRYAVGR